MHDFIEWRLEQKGWVMVGFSVVLYILLLVMWFGFDLFWPWGFGLTTALAIAGIFVGGSKV